MTTKFVTISTAKASKSAEYRASWIGKQAFYETYEGDEILGTITHWQQYFPVVTFSDGSWGRLNSTFRIFQES